MQYHVSIESNSPIKVLMERQRQITKTIKEAMLPGLEYNIKGNSLTFDLTTFDESGASAGLFVGSLFNTLAEHIATEMAEFDFPITRSQGQKFCEFMGFNDEDSMVIYNACATDAQFKEYSDYERRSEI